MIVICNNYKKHNLFNFFRYVSSKNHDDLDETPFWQRKAKKTKYSSPDIEIQKYLAEENISTTEDPLSYWKSKIRSSPSLREMAKVYLAVPCTSTPSERAFSLGRL